jgi:UDP-glucose 4-epimerase
MLQHQNAEPRSLDRIVVIGGSGFIGSRLTAKIREQGAEVLSLSSKDLDLADPTSIGKLAGMLKPEDSLVMLSALTPDKGRGVASLMRNLSMAQTVCGALEKSPCSHVVYFSSDAVYPFSEALITTDSPAAPTDLYGVMHRTREIMFQEVITSPLAILRTTIVYGHGDPHNSYGPNRFRRIAAKEGKITLFGDGEETRDHIFVDDLVSLLAMVLRHRSSGILNAATGRSIPFYGLAQLVAKQFDKKVQIVCTPRANPITHRAFDPTTCQKAFPSFRFTPLEEGIARVHRQMMEDI